MDDVLGDPEEGTSTRTPSGIRVLVVEDEALVARHVLSTLKRRGFEPVGRAATGEDAVRMSRELDPDLIVADIHLRGGLDGIDAVARIREELDPAVVFLTAYSDDETLGRAMATEPSGYLTKPFSERGLCCAVEVAVARNKADRAARAQVTRDDLTGLYNRRAFRMMAEHQLKIGARYGRNTALLFFDLDGLKHINDELGHAYGDAALREFSAVLSNTFRGSDIVARLGGDEFVVLAVDCSLLAAEGLRERVRGALAERCSRSSGYRLSTSVGIAVAEVPSVEPLESLMSRADAAMYTEKRRRKEARAAR